MHYYIYCNKKNISKNHQNAIEEYAKRLSAYCETNLFVSETLSFTKNITADNHQLVLIKSGPSNFSSEAFSSYINEIQQAGKSNLHIFIGFDESDLYHVFPAESKLFPPFYLSLTRFMLLPETVTVLFFEQLYRAYTILQGKTYHK